MEVIKWFINVNDKISVKFVRFDIDGYYTLMYPILGKKGLLFSQKKKL